MNPKKQQTAGRRSFLKTAGLGLGALSLSPSIFSNIPGNKKSPDIFRGFHYQPEGAIFGDPVPFFHNGVHHVYYLHRKIDDMGNWIGMVEWYHLATRDFVNWEVLPPAITADDKQFQIPTGSVIEKDGVFHAFYGSAPRGERIKWGVCHATSTDLVNWKKDYDSPLFTLAGEVAAVGTYSPDMHWRDPHVFWNPDTEEWWMAVAAQEKAEGIYGPAGAVALATSDDLLNWKVQKEPMLRDRECIACECPDVFPFGEGWAMVYYTDTTRIRFAKTLAGPWHRTFNDTPGSLHIHAAKTSFDGKRRLLHTMSQTVTGDYGPDEYGGKMALPRELYLDSMGIPSVRLVPEIIAACNKDATGGRGGAVMKPLLGSSVLSSKNEVSLNAQAGETLLAMWKEAPPDYFLNTMVTIEKGGLLALMLRGTPMEKPVGRVVPSPVDDAYVLRLDAVENQVSLHRWNGWNRVPPLRAKSLKIPVNKPFALQVMLNGDILEVFVDERISLTSRLHLPSGSLTLLARDARVSLDSFQIARLIKE